jgi:hypothetical protein
MNRAVFLIPVLLGNALLGGEIHTFTSNDGKTLQAEFLGLRDSKVSLKLKAGNIVDIPISRLAEPDQAYVKEQAAEGGKLAEQINKAAGHPIADATPLAERDAAVFADRLGLRLESDTKFGKSWRLYASFVKDYKLFGAIPYSIALYSDEDGKVRHASVVYANKGDFGSAAGFGEEHFKQGEETGAGSLAEAMIKDDETVSAALTKVLGAPKEQRFGDSGTRRTIERWDWNGHSFLLSHVEGEYVGLAIMPTADAEAGGRSERRSDAEVKARLQSGIVRKDNGDVYLGEIPMVDQGPKGYCVPATFERAMRAMGIDADMYLLAMVGQSSAGGGTVVELLLENVKSQVYRKGRRTKEEEFKQLKLKDVKRYIDQGTPVMWRMHSVDGFNKLANELTEQREAVKDWTAYAADLAAKSAALISQPKPEENGHLCLIIGYNETTNELAVSDSWGRNYALRWVPVAVADWVSREKIFLILP